MGDDFLRAKRLINRAKTTIEQSASDSNTEIIDAINSLLSRIEVLENNPGGSFSGTMDDIADGITYVKVSSAEKTVWNNKADQSFSVAMAVAL